MSVPVSDPVDGPASSYWLSHCEGFRVDAPGGRVGLVEAALFRSRPDRPDALIVRAGLFGRRFLIVPAEEIEDVLARKERVVLRASPEIGRVDFLPELLRRAAADGQAAEDRLSDLQTEGGRRWLS